MVDYHLFLTEHSPGKPFCERPEQMVWISTTMLRSAGGSPSIVRAVSSAIDLALRRAGMGGGTRWA
jgi:hypothetical protein